MDFLPTPPKKWKTLLALASAYYGVQAALPHLFEKKIAGDVAVVTGAGSGIGRLMALKLAKEGCKVALLDINVEAAAHVAAECEKLGATARAYKCNVVDREMVYAVGKQVEADFGRVDIVINNAGIVGGKKLMEADDKRMELTIQVNTIALLWVTKAFLGGMIERDHGHVVTIASSAGRVGIPNMVAYCASKFGAVGFVRFVLPLASGAATAAACASYCSTYAVLWHCCHCCGYCQCCCSKTDLTDHFRLAPSDLPLPPFY